MKVIELTRWDEFEGALDFIRSAVSAFRDGIRDELRDVHGADVVDLPKPSKTLFRGQPDANWRLATTLERQTGQKHNSISRYLKTIRGLKPQIETYTQESWLIPEDVEVRVIAGLVQQQRDPLVLYEYMAYLRHHGFPSPLLDWTRESRIIQ